MTLPPARMLALRFKARYGGRRRVRPARFLLSAGAAWSCGDCRRSWLTRRRRSETQPRLWSSAGSDEIVKGTPRTAARRQGRIRPRSAPSCERAADRAADPVRLLPAHRLRGREHPFHRRHERELRDVPHQRRGSLSVRPRADRPACATPMRGRDVQPCGALRPQSGEKLSVSGT